MSGLYIHIPFCKQACHYCNFHFSTSLKYKEEMVAAIVQEIEIQKDYLQGDSLQSIYFGGGTPSLLSAEDLEVIFNKIHQIHSVADDTEITLETNPDDLNWQKLQMLKQTPINRLSIGIQSFFEEDLKWMNRAHNATEAKTCIENALASGFSNLTVDLIYGSPTTSHEHWQHNIDTIFAYGIPHISCYCLTIEPNTALDHFVKKGKSKAVDEEQAARQFEVLMAAMREQGYEHYEISNFAKPKAYAKHNSNYWAGEKYLGIGPSAHSFNGQSRQWNIANNAHYLKGIQTGKLAFEVEALRPEQRYNEYIMTSMRTMWGADLNKIATWGKDIENYFLKQVETFLAHKTVVQKSNHFCLTDKGRLLADHIASELFVV